MYRVSRSTKVALLPAVPGGEGAGGYFSQGDPGTGALATIPGYEWFNRIQEEIIAVIDGEGIALDPADNTQLRTAITKMIAGSSKSVIVTGVTFEASVVDGEPVRWDSGNNRFDEATADGTANNRAVGVADVTNLEVICFGETRAGLMAGLTPGARYYLDDVTPGGLVTIAPADKVVIGIAKAADVLYVDIDAKADITSVDQAARDINTIQAWQIAELMGSTALAMVNTISDTFTDQISVDLAASLNETYNAAGEYFTNNAGSPLLLDSYAGSADDITRMDANRDEVGQGFNIATPATVSGCKFHIRRGSAAAGPIVCRLYASTGTMGVDATPTGAALAASAAIDANTISSSAGLVDFPFTAPVAVAAGDYFVALEFTTGNNPDWVEVFYDNTSPAHSGNAVDALSTGGPYTVSAWDILFEAYGIAFSLDMELVSAAFVATSAPGALRGLFDIEEVDAAVLNVDVIGKVSTDGATWATLVLGEVSVSSATRKVYAATAVAGMGAGTTPKIKFETFNGKEIRLHGWGLQSDVQLST